MKAFKLKSGVAILGALALMTNSFTASAAVTGHLDVVSKYVLRGITTTYGSAVPVSGYDGNANGDAPESSKPSLQGGLDYSDESGIYLGYSFETIGYNYAGFTAGASMEHDTYGGYAGKIGDVGYKVGVLHINYFPEKNSTGSEAFFGVSYKEFGFTVQPWLNDTSYANKGDTYITASYATTVAENVGLSATVAYYKYQKTGDYTDLVAKPEAVDGAFRHLTVGASYPFAKNVSGSLSYIFAGQNRYGVKQDNQAVGSVSYTF